MSDILNKITLPKGASSRTKMDLSSTHLLTTQFGQLDVITNLDVVPSDEITCNVSGFGRVTPMLAPAFASARVALKAFYVPYNKVWKYFEDWQSGKVNVFSNGLNHPAIVFEDIVGAFIQQYNNGNLVKAGTSSNYDIKTGSSYYLFTSRGKYINKLLKQLGYVLPWCDFDRHELTRFNAMPLYAFIKCYVDYIQPSSLRDNSPIASILNNFYQAYSPSPSMSHLQTFFDYLLLPYDMDYFTSAWDSLSGPRSTNTANDTYNKPNGSLPGDTATSTGITASQKDFGSSILALSSSSSGITDQMIRQLLAFRNYMLRNGVVGSRAVDRLFARFGITAPDAYFDRCDYLGKHYIDLHIADIKNTSSSGGATLGSYAGQGYIGNDVDKNTTFSAKCYTYGKFFVIGSIMPHTLYYQGCDSTVLNFGRSDYFTPEYDQLGNAPVAYGEFFSCSTPMTIKNTLPSLNSIFGYMPRYAGMYKVPKHRITGEYVNNLKEFQLGRDVSELANNGCKAQSDPILFATPNDLQYNRIFADTSADTDKFLMSYNFGITAVRPMCTLYDSLGITGGSDVNINNQGMIIDN